MRRTRVLMYLTVVSALMITGCSSGGSTDTAENITDVKVGLIGSEQQSTDIVEGGDLAYATFSGVSTLDPSRQDGGSTGGSEMAAIYDLLMRYDPSTDEYVPQLAESLSSNDDRTEWTLTFRDGVTFSDGTPVDAEAFTWSVDHYLSSRGTHAQLWKSVVDSVDVVDPRTARIKLTTPWPQFPALLTTGPGMVVAPSSMATGEFQPIGAGPFTVSQFQPQSELTLAAREDYWGGTPHLDTLSFPVIVDGGARLDALRNGDIEAAYFRSAGNVSQALATEPSGYVYSAGMGAVLAVNQRADRAASDERVRKAIVAAINPQLFDERANNGHGMPGSSMFQKWSRWRGEVTADGYDPERARTLLAEAKADGYDGTLTYAGLNAAYAKDHALAIQSMLEAVGFSVNLDFQPSMNALISTMYIEHDYDIGESGFNVAEEAPYIRLFSNLHSDSSSNVLGVQDADADQILGRLQAAESEDDRRAVLDDLQSWVNSTAPFAVLGATKNFIAWRGMTGIMPSADGIMLFGKAARTAG